MQPFCPAPTFCNITDGVAWGGHCIYQGTPVFISKDGYKGSGPWVCSDCIYSILSADAWFNIQGLRFGDWIKTVGKKKNEHSSED